MSSTDDDPSGYTRRRFLTLSIASGASASLLLSRKILLRGISHHHENRLRTMAAPIQSLSP